MADIKEIGGTVGKAGDAAWRELTKQRSRIAMFVDANPRKTAAGIMVAGPLAVWKAVEIVASFL